eukprot:74099-Amphidinium_carterae.3
MPGHPSTIVLAGTMSLPLTRHIEPMELMPNFCKTSSVLKFLFLCESTMAWRPDITRISANTEVFLGVNDKAAIRHQLIGSPRED